MVWRTKGIIFLETGLPPPASGTQRRQIIEVQITPYASIALATFANPAIFAPRT